PEGLDLRRPNRAARLSSTDGPEIVREQASRPRRCRAPEAEPLKQAIHVISHPAHEHEWAAFAAVHWRIAALPDDACVGSAVRSSVATLLDRTLTLVLIQLRRAFLSILLLCCPRFLRGVGFFSRSHSKSSGDSVLTSRGPEWHLPNRATHVPITLPVRDSGFSRRLQLA